MKTFWVKRISKVKGGIETRVTLRRFLSYFMKGVVSIRIVEVGVRIFKKDGERLE